MRFEEQVMAEQHVKTIALPQTTECCVEHANKHQDGSYVMEINTRNLTECKRRCVNQQRTHHNHINEE